MISPNEVESQDSFVRSGGSPPLNLAWFRDGASRRERDDLQDLKDHVYVLSQCIHIDLDDLREGQKCYCSECVWDRNDRPSTESEVKRIEDSKRRGILYQEMPELVFDAMFVPDIQQASNYLRIKPSLMPPADEIAFQRAITDLRAEHRARLLSPLASRSVLNQTFNSESSAWLPWTVTRSSAPTFGTRGGCFSTRIQLFADNKNKSRSIENIKRRDNKYGEVTARIWVAEKPPSEYVEGRVMLGGVSIPLDDINSQGSTRVVVRGHEMLVTDWWAAQYKKATWKTFIGKSVKIILKDGDRMRDEFFEPTAQQMAQWRSKYTKDGKLKNARRERFRKMLPKWLFKNQTDEAPAIAQAYKLNELEHDFNNVYEDGAEVEKVEAEDATHGLVDEVTQPGRGKPFGNDLDFVSELNRMLPKGYSTLSLYLRSQER